MKQSTLSGVLWAHPIRSDAIEVFVGAAKHRLPADNHSPAASGADRRVTGPSTVGSGLGLVWATLSS